MSESFYVKDTNVYRGKKLVQKMQSRNSADQLAKHLNEIRRMWND